MTKQLEEIIEDLLQDPDWMAYIPHKANKHYSGRITLCVSPEEHKLLLAKATARKVPLNRYAKEKALGQKYTFRNWLSQR